MWVQSLGWEDPLEEGTATYSSILAQKMTWTEDPGGLDPQDSKELDMTEATEHTARILFEYIACGEGMARRNKMKLSDQKCGLFICFCFVLFCFLFRMREN